MTEQGKLLNEALELLLKLSNKPHFFYVEEVKVIAEKVHTAYNLPKQEPIEEFDVMNSFSDADISQWALEAIRDNESEVGKAHIKMIEFALKGAREKINTKHKYYLLSKALKA